MDARSAKALLSLFIAPVSALSQELVPQSTPLTVPAGAPLRLYLTKRVPKRLDAPAEARLLTPLYAFDREVVPAGTAVAGRVASVDPVSRWTRIRALLGGDFTPLHTARIEFNSFEFSDGRRIQVSTIPAVGLNSLVPLKPPKARKQKATGNPTGAIGKARQAAKDQVAAQVHRVTAIPDVVRGPDKRERVIDFLMTKLPYHPQYVRKRTRIDVDLREPLDFGRETVEPEALSMLGAQPAPGSIAHARLLTPLDSRRSTKGQKVEAALAEPLFNSSHMLVLPEGTRLEGSVVVARRARLFHRGGRLMFNFQNVALAPEVEQLTRAESSGPTVQAPPQHHLEFRARANVAAVESTDAPLKVDQEGGVRTVESKKRFLSTVAALLIAQRGADSDSGRAAGAGGGQGANVGGRTLGGAMGFGLLGSAAGRYSVNAGMALSYYGLAWSVFSTVVARGAEVQFSRNAVVDVGFSTRTEPDQHQLKSTVAKVSAP